MINDMRALYQVMRGARMAPADQEKLVYDRLRNVLLTAYSKVPYYREAMRRADYNPVYDYSGPGDLKLLPITQKQTIKQRGSDAFLTEGIELDKCYRESTSGSTGIPLVIYRSRYERSLQIARWLRVLLHNGYNQNHKAMSLTPPWRLDEGRSIFNRVNLLRRLPVNFHSSAAQMVDALLAYQPQVLYGIRTHIDMIAYELKRRNIEYKGLKLLLVGGEIIHEKSRVLYQKQFGIALTETYGTTEIGVMLHETPEHDGLHAMDDLSYYEFLDSDGAPVEPGQLGRIIVTDLLCTTMPFIRYDQGDSVVLGQKRAMDDTTKIRIEKIIGREDDFVILPDGRKQPFYLFYIIMNRYENILQFRAVQKKQDLIQLYIATDQEYFAGFRDDLLSQLRDQFGHDIEYELVRVNKIEPDPGGKIRMLVSEL